MKALPALIVALVLIAAFSSAIYAGDYAQLNFIGFSKDGHFLAFEEFGTSLPDMKGYSTVYFVDTAKNTYAAPPISATIEDAEDGDNASSFDSAARRRTALKAAPVLKRLGIIAGNTGRLVISRLLTDVTDEKAPPYEPKSVAFAPDRRESMLNGRYFLTLKTVSKGQFCRAEDDLELVEYEGAGGIPIPKITENPNRKTSDKEKQKLYSFELSLRNDDAGKTIMLKDPATKLSDRRCTIDYRINSVNIYKDQIVVFVGVFTPGFLGDDIRIMAVTGKIGE